MTQELDPIALCVAADGDNECGARAVADADEVRGRLVAERDEARGKALQEAADEVDRIQWGPDGDCGAPVRIRALAAPAANEGDGQ